MGAKKQKPFDNPPWMDIAWHEYILWNENEWTINDIQGFRKVLEYVSITGQRFNPLNNGWCGCFVDWVLKKTNEIYGTAFSTVVNNPSSSQNYSTKKRYPSSLRIPPRVNDVPYGSMVVLHFSQWQGHIGFLVDSRVVGKNRYVYLLSGNQNDKVCVQKFKANRDGSHIHYTTDKGKVFVLRGFFYPKEFDFYSQNKNDLEYCKEGYIVDC